MQTSASGLISKMKMQLFKPTGKGKYENIKVAHSDVSLHVSVSLSISSLPAEEQRESRPLQWRRPHRPAPGEPVPLGLCTTFTGFCYTALQSVVANQHLKCVWCSTCFEMSHLTAAGFLVQILVGWLFVSVMDWGHVHVRVSWDRLQPPALWE